MICIHLKLMTGDFNKSMDQAKENIKKTSNSLAKGSDLVTSKAVSQLAGLARMVAAPLAGAMSIGSMIKNYFSGVAQVAQMTGAYSTKLEEWRKKRALLSRVTKEDIALYKKSRKAVTDFQIAMGDLSAKLVRTASPAFKFMYEKLEKISRWVDDHSDDIVRFLRVLAAVIAVTLIPTLMKLTPWLLRVAAAMLANPLTWIIAAIGLLAIAIDDLIVYLKGGNSAFDKFWKMLGLTKGDTALLNKVLGFLGDNIGYIIASLMGLSVGFKAFSFIENSVIKNIPNLISGITKVVGILGGMAKVIGTCTLATLKFTAALLANPITWVVIGIAAAIALVVAGIWALWKNWDQISAWITKKCSEISGWFTNIGNSIKTWFSDKIDAVKQTWNDLCTSIQTWYNKIIGWFKDIGKSIKEAFSFDGISKKVDSIMSKFNPKNWSLFGGDSADATEAGLGAERASRNAAAGGSSWFDSHATLNLFTNSKEVAGAAIEQVVPGSSAEYTNQAALGAL